MGARRGNYPRIVCPGRARIVERCPRGQVRGIVGRSRVTGQGVVVRRRRPCLCPARGRPHRMSGEQIMEMITRLGEGAMRRMMTRATIQAVKPST